jgi:hypothetical protein
MFRRIFIVNGADKIIREYESIETMKKDVPVLDKKITNNKSNSISIITEEYNKDGELIRSHEYSDPTRSAESKHSPPSAIPSNSPLFGIKDKNPEIAIPHAVQKVKNKTDIENIVTNEILKNLFNNMQSRIFPGSTTTISNIHIYDYGTNERLCHTFYINTVLRKLFILVPCYYFHNIRTQKSGKANYKSNPTDSEFVKMGEYKTEYENILRNKFNLAYYKNIFLERNNGDILKARKEYEYFLNHIYKKNEWANA